MPVVSRKLGVAGEMRIEYSPLSEVLKWPRNPKRHDEPTLDASIERFGFNDPPTLDEGTGHLVEGHGRIESLERRKRSGAEPPGRVVVRKDGEWMVPIVRGVSFETELEAEAYLVAHNRVGIDLWDDVVLAEVLAAHEDSLEGLGFSSDDVAEILSGAPGFKTVKVSVGLLKPHPKNYKQHPDDQLAHIVKSIEEHGFYKNIVVARGDVVLAGHGVVQAAIKMGKRRVPVIKLDVDPDDPRALKIMTSDNEISNLAETDDRALTELLKGILGATDDLGGTGFDEQQLAAMALVTRPGTELADSDAAAQWVGMPEHATKELPFKIMVNCETEEDLVEALGLLKAKYSKVNSKITKTWSVWWPPREKEDQSAVRFTDADAAAEEDGS